MGLREQLSSPHTTHQTATSVLLCYLQHLDGVLVMLHTTFCMLCLASGLHNMTTRVMWLVRAHPLAAFSVITGVKPLHRHWVGVLLVHGVMLAGAQGCQHTEAWHSWGKTTAHDSQPTHEHCLSSTARAIPSSCGGAGSCRKHSQAEAASWAAHTQPLHSLLLPQCMLAVQG